MRMPFATSKELGILTNLETLTHFHKLKRIQTIRKLVQSISYRKRQILTAWEICKSFSNAIRSEFFLIFWEIFKPT
jgi:hypothetical protein